MTRKMHWGLAFLILLLVTAAVFVILREIADNRELDTQLTEAEELVEQINQRKISENNKKLDETVGNPLQSVDKSGNVQNSASASDVSASDKQSGIELPPDYPVVTGVPKIPFWERLGLDPPDGDMTYRQDKYGNYQKVYKGQVWLGEVKFRKGYAPTLEQHKKMQKLLNAHFIAQEENDTAEVRRTKAEIDALKEAAQGDLPYYDGGGYLGKPGESKEEAIRNSRRQSAEAGHQLYVEYGLEHISPYR